MNTLRRPSTQCTRKKLCTSKECRDCKDGLGANEHFVPKPEKVIEPMTPESFHRLPVPKKIHALSMAYMAQCTTEGFSKKSLFALNNYFRTKVDPVNYQVFFDWIHSLTEVTPTNLYDIYNASQRHQLQLRLTANKADIEVEAYPSLLSFINEL